MQRAFLNLMQSTETTKDADSMPDKSSEIASNGIISLMKSTVELFKLGISPKTYKVIIFILHWLMIWQRFKSGNY